MSIEANARLREDLASSQDPRVQRTRALIVDAVHELSDSGAPVTVSSIAQTAGISRASFYSHYAGVDDLAARIRQDTFTAIAENYSAAKARRADALLISQQHLVAHFADNKILYRAVSQLPASAGVYRDGVRTMAALIAAALPGEKDLPPGLDRDAAAYYIASAAYGLLDAWVRDEITLTRDALVAHLMQLLPPWFRDIR